MSALRIDWATHEAALFACQRWHYSKVIPAGKMVRVGVWEEDRFIGVVLFSRGANNHMLSPYGLGQAQGCELTRVALTKHVTPVTRIVRIAISFLLRNCPGLRLIISYADPEQGHHGGIYQGGNWIYVGPSRPQSQLIVNGKPMHKRSATARWGTASPTQINTLSRVHVVRSAEQWKHTYLMPLDADMRARIIGLAKTYPMRTKDQDAEHPSALGGETPTRSLHHPSKS